MSLWYESRDTYGDIVVTQDINLVPIISSFSPLFIVGGLFTSYSVGVFSWIAVLGVLFGSFGAVYQVNYKRFMHTAVLLI